MESCGIHELLYRSLTKLDIDLRGDFYTNCILTGGSSMIPGKFNDIFMITGG